MHGSVADSSMKFDSDVERVAEMLWLTIFIFNFLNKLERCWLGSAHRDFVHIVASMSCVKLLDCHVVVFVFGTTLVRLFLDRSHAQLAALESCCFRYLLVDM